MCNCRKIIRKILWVTAGFVFLFSAFMLWKYQAETNASSTVTEDMIQIAMKSYEQISLSGDNKETMLASDYGDLLRESAPISIDFDALIRENADIVAWIYCPDTPINYPVVQSDDNSYYLRRLINGTWNSFGTLFLDYRNSDDFSDINSVIYGHNMNNDSMFGTLTDYKNQEYYEKHPVFYLLTTENDYKVELLAGCTVPSDSIIYDIPVLNEKTADTVMSFIESSTFTAKIDLKSGDRLLTLSTCAYEYDNARYVVMGVLKKIVKNR